MDTRNFAKLASLQHRKAQLEAELKRLNEEISGLEGVLLEDVFEEGIDKMTVTAGEDENGFPIKRTVYLERKVWAGHNGDAEELNEALKQAGLNEYVQEKVNANSLSAFVREYDPEKNLKPDDIRAKLPEPLRDVIKISEQFKLKSRRA